MASKGKSPGLTGFFEKKDAAEEAESTAGKTRMKGTGKYYHVTLRLSAERWERALSICTLRRNAALSIGNLDCPRCSKKRDFPTVTHARIRVWKRNKKGAIKPGFEGVGERILPWK